MRRISRVAAAALAAWASVSSTAQVLTRPLSALPAVRLTDACSTQENDGIIVGGSLAFATRLADLVNDPGADAASLRSLWWPVGAGDILNINGSGFVVVRYGSPFQDTDQIAGDILAAWAPQGATSAGTNGFGCFDPSPPPPIFAVAEFANPRNDEYRLAVGNAEAASLSADGWLPTGDAFHVLGAGTCYGGHAVFRFVHTQDGPRGGNLLTMDPVECGSIRKSNPAWWPQDVPFYSAPLANGACTGQYSGVPVYRIAFPRAPMAPTIYRFISNKPLYDELISQGWTGRGIAFCAMP